MIIIKHKAQIQSIEWYTIILKYANGDVSGNRFEDDDFQSLDGIKSDGINRPFIFKLVQFVTLDNMTCVSPGANALQMSTTIFVEMIAPCDLYHIIAYASTMENSLL